MAGVNGLADCTWDSASCAFFRFGSTKVALTKFEPPKTDIKVEKIRRIGEMIAGKRTPGIAEVSDPSIELLTSDFASIILPRMPIHGGTLVEFVVTATVTHPSVSGSFGIFCDGCRIIGEEGPPFDGTEKGLLTKLTLSVMEVWRKGHDGKLKALSMKSSLPSSQLNALLAF